MNISNYFIDNTLFMYRQIIIVLFCFFIGINAGISQKFISLIKVQKGGKFGFLDDSAKEIIPCEFDIAGEFTEGLIPLKKGDNWYYYNTNGSLVLDLGNKFTVCGQFQDSVAFVTELPATFDERFSIWRISNKELQYIDRKGNIVLKIDNEWEAVFSYPSDVRFYNGMLRLMKQLLPNSTDWHFGFMDKSGKLVLPFEFRNQGAVNSENFSEGMAGIGIDNYDYKSPEVIENFGYINKRGAWLISPKYKKVYPFKYGAGLVQDANPKLKFNRFLLIDKQGKPLFSVNEETAPRYVRDSLIAIYKNGRDSNGNRAFDSLRSALAKTDGTFVTDYKFAGLTPGKANDLWLASYPEDEYSIGYVNDFGEVVIPFEYGISSKPFEHGIAIVSIKDANGSKAVINAQNEFILPPDPKAEYFIYGGVIYHYEGKVPDGIYDYTYYNSRGQKIDFQGYTIRGRYEYLALPQEK